MEESGMSSTHSKAVGVACAALLMAAVGISLFSLRRPLPASLGVLLWPGFVADTVASGRAGYAMSPESTAFFNIVLWSVVLIGAAIWLSPHAPQVASAARHSSEALVSVYLSADPAELPVVESLLTEAGIAFTVRGEAVQGMLGGGQIGSANLVVPLEVYVAASEAATARELLGPGVPAPDWPPAT